jgi:competence protein ComEA
MFDEFLYKFRFYIGGVLVFLILAGSGVILWDKFGQTKINRENQLINELKTQNELLRQQLSLISQQQVAGASIASNESVGDKININTADLSELDKIPGVGPARAADIINYRETHGNFKAIEEMKNIKGIGDKTFESMKDLITTGE